MNEENRKQGAKRRRRIDNPETSRMTGEQARAKPSMSIPGFTERDLGEMAEKLRMLGMAMDDWSPVSKRRGQESADETDQETDS